MEGDSVTRKNNVTIFETEWINFTKIFAILLDAAQPSHESGKYGNHFANHTYDATNFKWFIQNVFKL